jgi:hypothetical protein|tara:strand:+ start:885 stop:1181 length:297 start_codon:yes stop_codon:yes gene_type:complete
MSIDQPLEQPEMSQDAKMNSFIQNVVDDDFSKAAPTFHELLQAKMDDALDQEKIAVAAQMFNGAEEELDDDDPSEEDIDAAIDELDDDTEEEEDETEE